MKTLEWWVTSKFWLLWGINAVLAAGVLCIFLRGLLSGFVSGDNIIPWTGILLLTAAVVGGSLWQRSLGHPVVAAVPLLVFLVPCVLTVVGSLLFGVFYFVVFALGNGRMN